MPNWTSCMNGYGWGMGWGMSIFAALSVIALVLTIAALAKYVFAAKS